MVVGSEEIFLVERATIGPLLESHKLDVEGLLGDTNPPVIPSGDEGGEDVRELPAEKEEMIAT